MDNKKKYRINSFTVGGIDNEIRKVRQYRDAKKISEDIYRLKISNLKSIKSYITKSCGGGKFVQKKR